MQSFALVANPVSGHGAARRAARVTLRMLEAAGLRVCLHETRGPGDAAEWLRERPGAFDVVVAVGGDGTLREVVAGLGPDDLVGLVPTGTANVVSRDLGIPRNPRRAVNVLLGGRTRSLDLGRANGQPFLAMVGVGIDGAIVQALSERRSGTIRMASYVTPGLKTLAGWRGVPLALEVDGEPWPETLYGVVVSNTRNYGGLFSVTPRADVSDGWLDWQAVRRPGRWTVLRWAVAAGMRRESAAGISTYGRGRRFRISASEPVAVQVDGDTFGMTPVEIGIAPASLRVLAPTGTEDPPA